LTFGKLLVDEIVPIGLEVGVNPRLVEPRMNGHFNTEVEEAMCIVGMTFLWIFLT
jgi:hypothetical protein